MSRLGFWKKRVNVLKVSKYTYHWLHKSTVSTDAPIALNLEPTNRCNLRCRFCSIDTSRETGFMDWDLFRSLVDQAAQIGVVSINLYLSGEPLLHPRITDMVQYVSDRRLFSYIHTNATLMNRELSGRLIDAGIDSISFSFDGEDKETYEANRIGAKYEKSLENIRNFLLEKHKRNSKTPHTRIQIIREVGPDGNEMPDIDPDFKELFKGLPLDKYHQIPLQNLRGEKSSFSLPQRMHYFPCFQLWSGLSVSWNGQVVGCCADLNAKFILGDLKTQPVLEVWRSAALQQMRRNLVEGKYESVPLCRECSNLWNDKQIEFSLASFSRSVIKDLLFC
jgi:radical SAM protein with 4Fe4S-binding SPASM domain